MCIRDSPNWTQWHRDPNKSGGGLFDLHLHDIDFMQYLFGRVKSVYAVGKASETGCWNFVMTTLKFENGNYCLLYTSSMAIGKLKKL